MIEGFLQHDNALEVRQIVKLTQQIRTKQGREEKQDPAAGVGQNMFECFETFGMVDRYRYRRACHGRQIGEGPGGSIGAHDRHPVAFLYLQGEQGPGIPGDGVSQLPPADVAIGAFAFVTQGRAVAPLFGKLQNQSGDGLVHRCWPFAQIL